LQVERICLNIWGWMSVITGFKIVFVKVDLSYALIFSLFLSFGLLFLLL